MCHSAHRHVVIGSNKDINKADVGKGPIVMKTAVVGERSGNRQRIRGNDNLLFELHMNGPFVHSTTNPDMNFQGNLGQEGR